MEEKFEKIKEKFKEVIAYSQCGIPDPKVDDLFNRWLEAKRDFIEAWDGQLIYEWPEKVSFELSQKEKNRKLDEFIDRISYHYANSPLADFIAARRDDFFSNLLTERYVIPTDYCDDVYNNITSQLKGSYIPSGMKMVKAFKYFEDGKVLNDIQNEASMLIQEDKISGKLCLSVHPLDFLSSSENTHNWRSCHALDGDYRAGNLSYMVDKSTIICYLKSEEDQCIPDFPFSWNSKKWRVLLFFSQNWNMIFAGRQYPFTTDFGIDYIKDYVLPRANMGNWTSWLSKKIQQWEENNEVFYFPYPYIPVGERLTPLNEIIFDESELHFNDLLKSSCYDPIYAYRAYKNDFWDGVYNRDRSVRHPKFFIGGKVKCLRCGKEYISISETMMCNDCELEYGDSESDEFAVCPCCGRRFYYDDGVYLERYEETICPDCADSEIVECPNCHEYVYTSDTIYDKILDREICRDCAEDIEERRHDSMYGGSF